MHTTVFMLICINKHLTKDTMLLAAMSIQCIMLSIKPLYLIDIKCITDNIIHVACFFVGVYLQQDVVVFVCLRIITS